MQQLQVEPTSLAQLQASYDQLYQGWMKEHQNVDQARRMLDLLAVQPGGVLVDVGCGTGYSLPLAAERGLTALGADVSFVALQQAQQMGSPAHVLLAQGEQLPLAAGSVDYVTILGSLEHFLDPGHAVRETARVLKKEGRAAVLVPNSHHIRALYNVLKYGEILSDLQEFERFATRREWEHLLTLNGLEVLSVHKCDTGWARVYRPGRAEFWWVYNGLFRLLGDRWIPLNLTYTFIFVCRPRP